MINERLAEIKESLRAEIELRYGFISESLARIEKAQKEEYDRLADLLDAHSAANDRSLDRMHTRIDEQEKRLRYLETAAGRGEVDPNWAKKAAGVITGGVLVVYAFVEQIIPFLSTLGKK